MARLGAGTCHLPADAAWAIALDSLDEDKTLVYGGDPPRPLSGSAHLGEWRQVIFIGLIRLVWFVGA